MPTCALPASICGLFPRTSFRKIQLTSPRQSPNFADIPSRVAEGLAQRCHGNRFQERRNDQVPIPGLKKVSDEDGESVDLVTRATLGGTDEYYNPH